MRRGHKCIHIKYRFISQLKNDEEGKMHVHLYNKEGSKSNKD
jgi:hypothetical protein